jgi:type IV pilus assembly protein PilA
MFQRKIAGFTLIELMISIAILGVLAAVGLVAFRKYTMRAGLAEVPTNLDALYKGAVAYYQTEHHDGSGQVATRQFPASTWVWTPSPMAICCDQPGQRCPGSMGNWNVPEFVAVGFSLETPFVFSYSMTVNRGPSPPSGTMVGDLLAVQALGDLGCDGPPWTRLDRHITVTSQMQLQATDVIPFYVEGN